MFAICTLPKELTNEWDKQPLGDQIVTDVASLLKSGHGWQCEFCFCLLDSNSDSVIGNVPGLATLSISSKACDVLVSFILQFG